MSKLTGECYCGAIRYEVSGPLTYTFCCHCSRCRKVFGGTGSALAFFDLENFKWIAGERFLQKFANFWKTEIGCCETCGSTVVCLVNGVVWCIALGSLNDNPKIVIDEHLYITSKASWDETVAPAAELECPMHT